MTKREKDQPKKMFRPVHSFVAQIDGKDVSFREDGDFIWEGDAILERYPHLFAEAKPNNA